jgi:uncharacterized membrane protein YjjB (DUF3815 family)
MAYFKPAFRNLVLFMVPGGVAAAAFKDLVSLRHTRRSTQQPKPVQLSEMMANLSKSHF